MANVPVGSRVAQVAWLATPDKYNGPKLFGDLVFTDPRGGRWVLIV